VYLNLSITLSDAFGSAFDFGDVFRNIFFSGDVWGFKKKVLSNHNVYIGDMFGGQFCISDVVGIGLYFRDVCGLPKQTSEIFQALIVSDDNRAAISVIMMLSNCNYSF
jgi:hypothetical protein